MSACCEGCTPSRHGLPFARRGRLQSLRLSRRYDAAWISARMSSTRHAVVRGPSFTGRGNLPVLTPCHQLERLIGIGPHGARIEASRTNPVCGRIAELMRSKLGGVMSTFTVSVRGNGRRRRLRLEIAVVADRIDPLLIGRRLIPQESQRLAALRLFFCRWAEPFSPDALLSFRSSERSCSCTNRG